jgi:putative transposase
MHTCNGTRHATEKVQHSFMNYTVQSITKAMKRNHDPMLKELPVNAAERHYQLWERNLLVEYLHKSPCRGRWNLAKHPEDYRWSSAAYYILNRDDFGFITNIYGDE